MKLSPTKTNLRPTVTLEEAVVMMAVVVLKLQKH
jgi:hypothetical protein